MFMKYVKKHIESVEIMKKLQVFAPVDGEVIDITKVKDDVFSQKLLGDGFAIKPENGNFVAPFKGKLVTVFPTGHAYGIRHKSGVEVLIHIGFDTVELKGEGFDMLVKQGGKVKLGSPLVNADLEVISKKAPSTDTPIVFSPDSMKDRKLTIVKQGKVKQGELIAEIE